MYPRNRFISIDNCLNGAGLWRVPDNEAWASTALRWCEELRIPPVEVFMAPLEVRQASFSVLDNSMLGAGLPARSIQLAERHMMTLTQPQQDALVAHELMHLALLHGKRPWYVLREGMMRNHTHEYQADAGALFLTSAAAVTGMLERIAAGDEDSFYVPAMERRTKRVGLLENLSHIPHERILNWIEGNIRA